jgi:DNA polymerase-3 subunit delta'
VPGFGSIPDLASILGQKQPIQLLTTLLRNDTVPHALLFIGGKGVGKKTTAMAFAMACNCLAHDDRHFDGGNKTRTVDDHTTEEQLTAISCGCCNSCRKIQSGNHPDIIHVEPTGNVIKISQIRDLCHLLSIKPFEAKLRVVIISDAQAMNPSASNALLKVLEEPPDRTILILTTIQMYDLFPTVVSRCQLFRFSPISRETLETLLVEKQGANSDEAEIIATMAHGSLAKALNMMDPMIGADWITRRIWLVDEIESLPSEPVGSLLAFAADLAKKKVLLDDSLDVIKSWFRDLVIYKYYPEKILNKDLVDRIQQASKKMTVASLLEKIDFIRMAQKDIQDNSNLRLTLEVLILRLARV